MNKHLSFNMKYWTRGIFHIKNSYFQFCLRSISGFIHNPLANTCHDVNSICVSIFYLTTTCALKKLNLWQKIVFIEYLLISIFISFFSLTWCVPKIEVDSVLIDLLTSKWLIEAGWCVCLKRNDKKTWLNINKHVLIAMKGKRDYMIWNRCGSLIINDDIVIRCNVILVQIEAIAL